MALEHAAETPEIETLGAIVAGDYVRLSNEAATPGTRFRAPLRRWRVIRRQASAVLHSHPNGEAYPSEADQAAQIATALPWCILPRGGSPFWWGGNLAPPALMRRAFRWGVTDCFSLLRDAYARVGVTIRDHPRAWGAWRDGAALYDSRFRAEGFEEVAGGLAALEPGDALLFAPRGKQATHAALYLGGNELLHHPGGGRAYDPSRIPRRDALHRWAPYLSRTLRHAS